VRLNVLLVVGARPNFVKAAALLRAFSGQLRTTLVHTGQHYDDAMAGAFVRDLRLPEPAAYLRVGSGSHATQTSRVMVRLERFLRVRKFDRLIVVGDVNSTMAAALVSAKLAIPVDHVEAGLRSGDRSMPEEINRIVTDSVCSRLFVSEPAGVRNLRREGQPASAIFHVGNVMIDTLKAALPRAKRLRTWRRLGVRRRGYGLVTLHRPSNVDGRLQLSRILTALGGVSQRIPLLFPAHPRTLARLDHSTIARGLRVTNPLGYLEFVSLLNDSRLVITDSGGVQEEATYLGIPCLTVRENTERPITVTMGTNTLVGTDTLQLMRNVDQILAGRYKVGRVPTLWDGRAARRIARILVSQA